MRVTQVNNNNRKSFGILGINFENKLARNMLEIIYPAQLERIEPLLADMKPKWGVDVYVTVEAKEGKLVLKSSDDKSYVAVDSTWQERTFKSALDFFMSKLDYLRSEKYLATKETGIIDREGHELSRQASEEYYAKCG